MNSPAVERAVGLFVLGGLACLAYFAFALGSSTLRTSETYPLEARFQSIAGLTTGAQVQIAGVPIGTVGKLKLSKDFSALVELKIRKDLQLSSDTVASIRSRGLLGDQYVALTPGGDDRLLQPGDRITDTESSVDLLALLGRFAFGSMNSEKNEKEKQAPKSSATPSPSTPLPSQKEPKLEP